MKHARMKAMGFSSRRGLPRDRRGISPLSVPLNDEQQADEAKSRDSENPGFSDDEEEGD